METRQVALPSVPSPRRPGAPEGRHRTPAPRRPVRSVWRRRAQVLNVVLVIGAAVAFALALTGHLNAHHREIELDRGIGELSWILGSAVLLIYGLGNLVIRPYLGTTRRLWASSLLFAVTCFLATAVVWTLENRDRGLSAVPGTRVATDAEAARYLDTALGPRGAAVPRIPTGVFVQSAKFAGANDVAVTGIVWQRYAATVPAALRKGVAFPEAGDSWSAKEVYRTTRFGVETVGWYFQATLRERFAYAHYPLDSQSVWLRMVPADITQNAAVVPDFSSYPPWRTDGRYGLDPGFVNEGWRTRYTAYSYVKNDYTSSFGTARYGDERPTPELYFNVGMGRDFVQPLISRLLPVFFIVVLVFASLFAVPLQADRRGPTPFSITGVIGFSVSMLLVITVQHASVRDVTGGQAGFVYLEWFFTALYFVIVATAVNALMMSTRLADGLLGRRGNLLPRLLYWPVIVGLLLAATLASFTG